jgi:hypothetical protein
MLEALPRMPDDNKLYSAAAAEALWAFWRELPMGTVKVPIPGVPDDDSEFDRFDLWTANLLRKGLECYAAAGGMTPEVLLSRAIQSFRKKHNDAKQQEQFLLERQRQWKLRLDRTLRELTLLSPDVLEKVARYENGLERSLFRNLHELQRLQAARCGATVTTPAAVDVDLTIHHKGDS